MRPRPSSLLIVALLTGCSGQSEAQPPHTPAETPEVHPRADDSLLRNALAAAESGGFDAAAFPALAAHPARAWVEYARLRRDIDQLTPAQAEAFLQAHRDDAVGQRFRNDWLTTSIKRGDWAAFQRAWLPGIERLALRCGELNARMATGKTDAAWMQDVRSLWLSGKPLPNDCAAPVGGWQLRGGLDDALRWQRIDLAIADNQPAVIREAANGLPGHLAARANAYAAALSGTLDEVALAWPRDARSRSVATVALVAMAKKSPDTAEAALPKYADTLAMSAAERGRVLYEIALQTASSYLPASAHRLAAVPLTSYDDNLHNLAMREAMTRRDWASAMAAIKRFPKPLRDTTRIRYLEARLRELTGQPGAEALYRQVSHQAEFHGFLAADRLGQPYPLCPWTPAAQPALERQVSDSPAMQRAMALYRIGRKDWAMAEWNAALKGFDDNQRRIAVTEAQANGWFDRAVFNLARENRDELRLYTLRFPIHHTEMIRREAARHDIDPAWIAAEIRAESLFDPNARSPANAMGLMQVLPSTGQAVAARIGLPWNGASTLYDADSNIAIGSAYLREMLDRWGDLPHAIAAYNAGPTPTSRWRDQRPDFDADFWIETISYRETREYVPRILAFSVIYDWRMNGDALRVSDRIAGKTQGKRVKFICPQGSQAGE